MRPGPDPHNNDPADAKALLVQNLNGRLGFYRIGR
jgi:hypothetical protein